MRAHRLLPPLILGSLLLLPACVSVPTIVATTAATTAVTVATDRRTAGKYFDDNLIELKTRKALNSDPDMNDDVHINITSINGIVLLTGETSTSALRERAVALIREVQGIRRIVNEIVVAEPTTYTSRSHDTWITGKVKTKLLATENIPSQHIKVVTENSVVYLMGLVTKEEGHAASETTRTVDGITRVVKLFEYLD